MTEGPGRRGAVLVIEDEQATRDLLTLTFELAGFSVEARATVADGERYLAPAEPDLVLVDVVLPDGSGFDVVARLRQPGSTGGGEVPLLVLSALATAAARMRGFR